MRSLTSGCAWGIRRRWCGAADLCGARRLFSVKSLRRSPLDFEDGNDPPGRADRELEAAFSSKQLSEELRKEPISAEGERGDGEARPRLVHFIHQDHWPVIFNCTSTSDCFQWSTTAKYSRKVHGPMHEWADEVRNRTGVDLQTQLSSMTNLLEKSYASPDDVPVNVFAFGNRRSILHCQRLLERVVLEEPAYVRLALFRRHPEHGVEWLTLRRRNPETRPPDIPAISLKTPGTFTLLFEDSKNAAIRSCFDETGIQVDSNSVFPTGMLVNRDPAYYWRPPVRYFIAQVPFDVEVVGPPRDPTLGAEYITEWDERKARLSSDPIENAWAQHGMKENGCAWMSTALINTLQRPLRGEHYMSVRYTPPPYANLSVVADALREADEAGSAASS